MSLDFFETPTIDEIIARCKTYIKSELNELNPTDQNSVIFGLITAISNLSNDNNMQIKLDILPNVFPQYCKTEDALENHAYIKNIPRTQATISSGKATIQGNIGVVIQLGAVLIANNKEYKNQNTVEIQYQQIALESLSVNGTLVTAITSSNHNFASGLNIVISGAEEEMLNGNFVITSTGLNSFTYSIQEEVIAEETGADLKASGNIAVLTLKSVETGLDTNLYNGDALALSDAIEGASANAYVQFSGISGGTDIESFEDWKDVVCDRYRNPITAFNENNIINAVKSISGNTRVWVYPVTPVVGQVTVFFVRDNDADIIPDANEIEKAREVVLALRTVKDDEEDVFIEAPSPKVVNFSIANVVPNTPTMKTAIENSIKELFDDDVTLGVNLTRKMCDIAISKSFDMETGSKLQSYDLISPSSDTQIAFGELAILGDIIFN